MVYYLKVNRENSYVLSNLQHWVDAISMDIDYQIYILCDNEKLKKLLIEKLIYDENAVTYLKSNYESEELKEILTNITLGVWEKIGFAHLTTFMHARENDFVSFWNIDADDTFVCLDPVRLNEAMRVVERHTKKNNVSIASLDMWHSISLNEQWSTMPHWSLGVVYVENNIDWIKLLKDHCSDIEYRKMKKLHSNIDWFFTYLATYLDIGIKTFCFDNMKFIHYYSDFFDYPHKGNFYHYKNTSIEFPIIKYCFGIQSKGKIGIARDVVRFDIGISDEESMVALINNCKEKEAFAQDIKSINNVNDKAMKKRFGKYMQKNGYQNVAFYGAGDYFLRNYLIIKQACGLKYICDGNKDKWGKEIVDGIKCMPPEELLEIEELVVVITVEHITSSFEIVRKLREIGIYNVEHIDNLKRYLLGFDIA